MHQCTVLLILIIGRPNPNPNPQSSSSILNLELSILNSCSKNATKVRDLRPKMSSKVRDSGQNVHTHHSFFQLCILIDLKASIF